MTAPGSLGTQPTSRRPSRRPPLRALAGTGHLADELRDLNAAIARPLPHVLRIAVLQVHGGSGCTTIARALTLAYTTRRSGRVLAVDVDPRPGGLAWSLRVPPQQWVPAPSATRTSARTSWQATEGLPRGQAESYLLGLPPGGDRVVAWRSHAHRIGRFFDVQITDWGQIPSDIALVGATGSQPVVCLVARTERAAIEAAARLVPALVQSAHQPVLVLSDAGHSPWPRARPNLLGLDVPVHALPFDPALASPNPDPRLRTATRLAVLRLAATLIEVGA